LESSISLNKYISDTGYCSRREADRLIALGRVMINNKLAIAGNRYTPGDEVVVDGSIVKLAKKEKRVILAFNKPVGITTTTEEQVKGNIISFINYPKRIFPIGRLDKDSEGLIFLTNDGDIVNKILRAGNQHEKEYAVQVNKPIDRNFLKNMEGGVPVMGTRTLPCTLRQTGKQSFSIILRQGLNRQIRQMCEYLGYSVTSLQRTRIMHVHLDKIAVGKWRYLSDAEMDKLDDLIANSSAGPEPAHASLSHKKYTKADSSRKSTRGKTTTRSDQKHIPKKSHQEKANASPQKTTTKPSHQSKSKKAAPERKSEKPAEYSFKAYRSKRKNK
jgi:23S rRNA pseudouridine2604 synthase